MAIQVGDKVPSATLFHMTGDGPAPITTDELLGGKKVVLFALPGAFTPTCSAQHVPSYQKNAAALRDKGVDAIACVSVNDVFVMDAWGKDLGTGGEVMMLADGSGGFTKAVGMELDLTERGLGVRSHRYAMVVEDGVVKSLHLEENPGALSNSGAETILGDL